MKRSMDRRAALAASERFREALDRAVAQQLCVPGSAPSACERWVVAGSIRRGKPAVGDVEIVAIPATGELVDPLDMFGGRVRANLLWAGVDLLLERGLVRKQVKNDGKTRWGDKYRALVWCDPEHGDVPIELWTAALEGWGVQLAIRTGPASLSRELVTRIMRRGRLVVDGGVLRYAGGPNAGLVCACSDERSVFTHAGLTCVGPEGRAALATSLAGEANRDAARRAARAGVA